MLLQNPGASFIKAAKAGAVDNLQGSVDALGWGKVPSVGTGGHFDIIYSGEVNFDFFLPVLVVCKVLPFNVEI